MLWEFKDLLGNRQFSAKLQLFSLKGCNYHTRLTALFNGVIQQFRVALFKNISGDVSHTSLGLIIDSSLSSMKRTGII